MICLNGLRCLTNEICPKEFGDFTLASGQKSTYYIDIKTAVTDQAVLSRIGQEMALAGEFDTVAGVAVGGVPLAVATSLAAGKPYAIIRAQEKGHGKSSRIIGSVKGRSVLLVEDVTTSGGSVINGIRALREAGARVVGVVTVVDRGQGAAEALAREGIPFLALATAGDLLAR